MAVGEISKFVRTLGQWFPQLGFDFVSAGTARVKTQDGEESRRTTMGQ